MYIQSFKSLVHGIEMGDAVFVQRGGRHHHIGASQQVFDHFHGAFTPVVAASDSFSLPYSKPIHNRATGSPRLHCNEGLF